MSSWINGETGGHLRVRAKGRNWFETNFPRWLEAPPPVIGPLDAIAWHLTKPRAWKNRIRALKDDFR